LGGAVVILVFLPWFYHAPVRSIRYRPRWNYWLYGIFVVLFFVLGYLGIQPPSPVGTLIAQIGTLYYFGFFLVILPVLGLIETPKRIPNSITEAVLEKQNAKAQPAAARA
jgi:ubiquinol-cytochrome c reductase cytochrome b subunit